MTQNIVSFDFLKLVVTILAIDMHAGCRYDLQPFFIENYEDLYLGSGEKVIMKARLLMIGLFQYQLK